MFGVELPQGVLELPLEQVDHVVVAFLNTGHLDVMDDHGDVPWRHRDEIVAGQIGHASCLSVYSASMVSGCEGVLCSDWAF